jgi:hypothetical protein
LTARGLIAGAAFVACASSVHAARPFITDDARVVRPGGCQLETFAKKLRSGAGSELWFLPACNPVERVELTAGGRRIEQRGEPTTRGLILQAKTLLRPLEVNDFGAALSVGATDDRPFTGASGRALFVNGILSRSFANDSFIVHANAGALRAPESARHLHTWGVGAELMFTRQLSGIAETYGQRHDPTSRQIGVRYWIVPDHFQVDGTLGNQRGASWFSAGIRLLF